MPSSSRARSIAQLVLVLAGLLLPTLSLVPLGGLWLWEHGILIHWAIGAAAAVGLAYLILRGLQRPPPLRPDSERPPDQVEEGIDPGWSTIEMQAWADVQGVADRLDVSKLVSREAMLDLGLETVQVVAQRLHPEIKAPVWQFTVPEGLAVLEQVSGRLGRFAVDALPFSEHLTVGQALALYRWRGAIGVVEKALDLWRLARVMNPTTAATHELRERVARQIYAWGRTHVGERLARAYVKEVGRAAIDLYGGRLRVHHTDEGRDQAAATVGDPAPRALELPRILIAGSTATQRSRLGRALAEALEREDAALVTRPPLVVVAETESAKELSALTVESDLVIWIAGDEEQGGTTGLTAIRALQARLQERFGPHAPHVLMALVRDRDLARIDQGQEDLEKVLGTHTRIADDDIFSIAPILTESYDASRLLARVRAILPQAKRGRIGRQRSKVRPKMRRIWSQAMNAGKAAARVLRK